MCVGSVWTQPPYNNTNPPSAFFVLILINHKQCLRTSHFLIMNLMRTYNKLYKTHQYFFFFFCHHLDVVRYNKLY